MPPMPGPCPARGSNTMNGRLLGSIAVPLRRDDPHQRVIHRPRQRAAVEHELGIEAQHMRRRAGVVLDIIVAALAQHVEQQNRALPRSRPSTRTSRSRRASATADGKLAEFSGS